MSRSDQAIFIEQETPKYMKTQIRVLTAVTFLTLGCAITFAQNRAIVAGWNILGVDPIPAHRVKNIANTIKRMNADLVVLTEVNGDDIPDAIVAELGDGYGQPVILEQPEGVSMNIALIFKTRVQVSEAELIDGSDLEDEPGSRKALAASVRIRNFDFLVIGVHLKSGRGNKERRWRSQQAGVISRYIKEKTADDEKDVLVIGDYNMIPATDGTNNDYYNFVALDPDNFLRFVSSDFLVGQRSHISGCNPLRGNLLDGYAISRIHTKEYRPGSTKLLDLSYFELGCSTYKRNYSDHFPVVSSFNVAGPDDD